MNSLFDDNHFFAQYAWMTQAQKTAAPSAVQTDGLSGTAQPELLLKDNMSALDLYKNVGLKAAIDWGVDPSEVFDTTVYLANKLAQLERDEPAADWTYDKLLTALEEANLTPLEHFEQYGADECISFTALFDSDEYLTNKTMQVYGVVTEENRQATLKAITDAGMNLWTHYETYGWKEDVDPSSGFDLSRYLDEKVAQMRESGGGGSGYNLDRLLEDLSANNLDPIEHYARYGKSEGIHASGKSKLEASLKFSDNEQAFVLNLPNLTKDMFKKVVELNGNTYMSLVYNKAIDAEKSKQDFTEKPEQGFSFLQDENKCWAATASNMLQWSGWVSKTKDYSDIGKLPTEDSIFKVFVDSFLYGNRLYGTVKGGLTWFGSPEYSDAARYWLDQPKPGKSGNHLKDLNIKEKITTNSAGNMTSMDKLADTLEANGTVGVRFYQGDKAHLVTCWGYTIDPSRKADDPGRYTGLIISDSDNNRNFTDPTQAPNSLEYVALTWAAGADHYTTDYASLPNLGFMTYLASDPMYFS